MSVLSSSAQCTDITMTEFSPRLREEVVKWINEDPEAHDWVPIMKYLAGKENM